MTRSLCAGERRANSVAFSAASASSASDELLDVKSEQHRVGHEPDIPAHLAADELIVAGEDFNADAMLVERRQRAGRGALGRIQECDVPSEHELPLVLFGANLLPGSSLVATARTRKPSLLKSSYSCFSPTIRSGSIADTLPSSSKCEQRMEYFFRRTLGEQHRLALGILHQHRHHAAGEVERQLIQLLVFLDQRLLVKIGAIQNRPVEQILEAGLKVADQVAVEEHLVGFTPRDIAMTHENHAVLGERAGLVGAEDIHAAEVLNGVEALDDHVLAAHGERAFRQADRDNHRQHLGRQADGDGQREKECPLPVVLGEAVDEENQRHHHGHELHHEPGEAVQTRIEARLDAALR